MEIIQNLKSDVTIPVVQVNKPHIVYETIEGETIVMNLKTGFYYSFDGIGPAVWEMILLGASQKQIGEVVTERYPDAPINIPDEVHLFIEELMENDIVSGLSTETPVLTEEQITEVVYSKVFADVAVRRPLFNIYADMRDVLLLDPIHDVDEKGWPEPKIR